MKTFLLLISFAYSSLTLAQYYPQMPNMNWQQSYTTCAAQTICPNGRQINCVVRGMNYSNVPSYMDNRCRWKVVPGRFIHCQGYALTTDRWGNTAWAQADIPIHCF